jgi:hypothetical protein
MLPHQRRSLRNHISLQVIFRQCASAAVFCSSPCADAEAVPLARGASADSADSETRRSQPTARLVAESMARLASSRSRNMFPPRCVRGVMDYASQYFALCISPGHRPPCHNANNNLSRYGYGLVLSLASSWPALPKHYTTQILYRHASSAGNWQAQLHCPGISLVRQ